MPPRHTADTEPPRPHATDDDDKGPSRRRRQPRHQPQPRILVTGAGGFVGRGLVDRLREHGWHPVTLSIHPPKSPLRPGETHVTSDVCSEGWERWCDGCEAAVNLVGGLRPVPASTGFQRANVIAVERVVRACRSLGISRLVSLSAAGAAANASTPYLRSKWAGEQVVEGSGLAWTVVRPTNIFGAGDRFSTSLARLVRRFPLVPVPGDGSARFQPIALEDVVAVLAALLRCEPAAGRAVELGGPETLSFDDLLRRVAHATNRRRSLLHVPLRVARLAVKLTSRRPDPWLTGDELTLLLAGSTAAPPPPELGLPGPTRRFVELPWLSRHRETGRAGSGN